MEEALKQQLLELLAIPSPTKQEAALSRFIENEIKQHATELHLKRAGDSFIAVPKSKTTLPKVALVGHLDVVPKFFSPYQAADRIHGAGASDMKAALAAMCYLIKTELKTLLNHLELSFIFYAREENTPPEENGLYELSAAFPEYFSSLSLALVGEPTDNTVQVGCVGSLHAEVVFEGEACHSARPWQGKNAVYAALPFLQRLSQLKPQGVSIFNQQFFEVMQLTTSHSAAGETTLPAYWKGNVNFRFAPHRTLKEAEEYFLHQLRQWGAEKITITSKSAAGLVLETPLFKRMLAALALPVHPKQAWTDVAQLTALKIPAFNYGPGLTAQCHRENEYTLLSQLVSYTKRLKRSLLSV